MDKLLSFLGVHFPVILAHKYLFLFLGSAIEGMNTMVLGGFLVSAGVVALLPILILFILGEMINSYLWYFVGYFAGAAPIDKWGRSKPKSEKIISTVQKYFEKYSGRAILVTKFTFSFTIATNIIAGSLKYDFKKYSLYNFIGSIGWVCMTLFTGYFFGQSYKLIFTYYLKHFYYVFIFLGGAIALIYILKLIIKSAFIKTILNYELIRHYRIKVRNGLDMFLSNDDDSKNN